LVVEVLSPNTEAIDRREKHQNYRAILRRSRNTCSSRRIAAS
jgi:hypothetical protein